MYRASIFVCLALVALGCAPQQETVTIGWMGPLTGDLVTLGTNARAAAQIAEEEINAAGGINGRRLKIIYEDTKCDPRTGASIAAKLISVDNVSVIVGPACSGVTLAASEIAEANERLLVSYCSSAPKVSEAGDFIFRTMPSDTFEGAFAARYLYDEGYRRVAVFSCQNSWCQGMKDVFVEAFNGLPGAHVVAEEYHQQSDRDVRTQLTKLRAADPDLLYMLSYTESTIPAFRQMNELGWQVPVFGANTWEDQKIPEQTGSASDGIRYTTIAPTGPVWFQERIKEISGFDMVICTPQSYDTVKMIAMLMEEGATSPRQLRDALYSVRYEGIGGNYTFDVNGDVVGATVSVREYKNGQIVAG